MAFLALVAAWLLCLSTTLAQSIIQPSNYSAQQTGGWSATQLVLSFKQDGAFMTFGVDNATAPWALGTNGISAGNFAGVQIGGPIIYTTPSYINNLTGGDIAYMSCDPQNYNNSDLGPDDTMKMATSKVSDGANTGNTAGAIVLYSTTSLWCNFTPPDSYKYQNVFILPQMAPARHLESILKTPNVSILSGNILLNETASNSNNTNNFNNGDDLGPTPTTTVAMIILYSVTGIITLCFIVVIITGAVRAHRHPDRYGLLNLPVGSHQRRARGIARAMLDTIPIVKFGEREPSKPADPEAGTELRDRSSETPPGSRSATTETNARDGAPAEGNTDGGTAETNEPATGQTRSAQEEAEAAEAGLACSVCTEDFVRGQDTRVLPCNHKFHPECIDPWLLNVSGTCPLCRVDLHPPEGGEHNAEDEDAQHSPTEDSMPAMGIGGTPVYRPLRFSTLLTPRRMRHATPEQRVRALRDLRNARRASNDEANAETPRVPRIRGTRLTRLLRRDTSATHSAASSEPVPQVASGQQHSSNSETNDSARGHETSNTQG